MQRDQLADERRVGEEFGQSLAPEIDPIGQNGHRLEPHRNTYTQSGFDAHSAQVGCALFLTTCSL
jgi:hypothetical protein